MSYRSGASFSSSSTARMPACRCPHHQLLFVLHDVLSACSSGYAQATAREAPASSSAPSSALPAWTPGSRARRSPIAMAAVQKSTTAGRPVNRVWPAPRGRAQSGGQDLADGGGRPVAHDDAVRQQHGLVHVVRDHDGGGARLGHDPEQLVLQMRARQRVQRRTVRPSAARPARSPAPARCRASCRRRSRAACSARAATPTSSSARVRSPAGRGFRCRRTRAPPPGARSGSRSARAAGNGSGTPPRGRAGSGDLALGAQQHASGGRVRPAIRFSSVDLPQPECPISVMNSPLVHGQVDIAQATKSPCAWRRSGPRVLCVHASSCGYSSAKRGASATSSVSSASPTMPITKWR